MHEQGVPMVNTQAARATTTAVAKLQNIPELSQDNLARELQHVADDYVSLEKDPGKRVLIEDLASNGITLFSEMVQANGGVELDKYLGDNLQSIVAHFERAAKKA